MTASVPTKVQDRWPRSSLGRRMTRSHADDITKGAVKDHTQNAIQMRNQWVQASLLLMVDYAMQM